MLLARMGKAWLKHHRDNGSVLWDFSISRLMSVVLVAALGAKSGDVAPSNEYAGLEYMTWCDIELIVEGAPQ